MEPIGCIKVVLVLTCNSSSSLFLKKIILKNSLFWGLAASPLFLEAIGKDSEKSFFLVCCDQSLDGEFKIVANEQQEQKI